MCCRYVTDATVAVFVALLLFIIPAHKPRGGFCCGQSSCDLEEEEGNRAAGLGQMLAWREPACKMPGLYGVPLNNIRGQFQLKNLQEPPHVAQPCVCSQAAQPVAAHLGAEGAPGFSLIACLALTLCSHEETSLLSPTAGLEGSPAEDALEHRAAAGGRLCIGQRQ